MSVHSLTPYRQPPCAECAELRRELEALKADRALYPFQQYDKGPHCIGCHGLLYKKSDALYYRKHEEDDRFCPGRHWFFRRDCPEGPHMHRVCSWCGARWNEAIASP